MRSLILLHCFAGQRFIQVNALTCEIFSLKRQGLHAFVQHKPMGTTEHPPKRSERFKVNLLRQGTPETFMMDGRAAQGQIIDVNAQNQRQMRKVVNRRQVGKLLTA